MRRAIATLPLIVLSLWLTALPALAAEGEAAEKDEINGILLALIFGAVVGAGLFVHAYRRGAESGHEDAATDEHH